MLDTASRARRLLETAGRRHIARFVLRCQMPAGGFADRAGQPDLYYSTFALSALAALGRRPRLRALSLYLDGFGQGDALDFVHLACLARCRQLRRLLPLPRWLHGLARRFARPAPGAAGIFQRLAPWRSADGGYNQNAPAQPHATAYACFLFAQTCDALGQPIPEPDRLLAAVARCRSADGGCANEPDRPTGVTAATAAALWLHCRCRRDAPRELRDWLLACACPDGGFRGTPDAPLPDLLSTATALFALATCRTSLVSLKPACLRFIDGLWDERSGGFRAHADDDHPDVEYTFYALLAFGALADAATT